MATVREIILKNDQKDDGTWNVKIRVTHDRKSAYISTSHFVTAKQLRKDFSIKDPFIEDAISPVLAKYRKHISSYGVKVELMSAKQIADDLKRLDDKSGNVDFGAFCKGHIAKLRAKGRLKSAHTLNTVFNALVDYFGTESFLSTDISSRMLLKFEEFIRTPRTAMRMNQGKMQDTNLKGVSDAGVHNYMRDLRLLFNAARDEFNDEDSGIIRIAHYPFKKYKIEAAPDPVKRNRTIEQIIAIRDCDKLEPGGRAEIARDMFMLSFYLCGINAVDIYKLGKIKGERIEYNRSKTAGKRKDRAFISIKVPDVARPLIDKYYKVIPARYASVDTLNQAIWKGLKVLGSELESPIDDLEFYDARHTFAHHARNTCRFSKDDVALAMNHVDQSKKSTDKYIAPNWEIIDEVQAAVIALLDPLPEPAS